MNDIDKLIQSASGCNQFYAICELRSWCGDHLGYVPHIDHDTIYVRDQSDVTVIQMVYPDSRWEIVVDSAIGSNSEPDVGYPHWVVRDLGKAPSFRIKMRK